MNKMHMTEERCVLKLTNNTTSWQGLSRDEINTMTDNEHDPQLCVLWDWVTNTYSLSWRCFPSSFYFTKALKTITVLKSAHTRFMWLLRACSWHTETWRDSVVNVASKSPWLHSMTSSSWTLATLKTCSLCPILLGKILTKQTYVSVIVNQAQFFHNSTIRYPQLWFFSKTQTHRPCQMTGWPVVCPEQGEGVDPSQSKD
jgi:hypothetical protein